VIGVRMFYPSAFEFGRRHGCYVALPGIVWNGLSQNNGPLGLCASTATPTRVRCDPRRETMSP
jgi:hypothetical protein